MYTLPSADAVHAYRWSVAITTHAHTCVNDVSRVGGNRDGGVIVPDQAGGENLQRMSVRNTEWPRKVDTDRSHGCLHGGERWFSVSGSFGWARGGGVHYLSTSGWPG